MKKQFLFKALFLLTAFIFFPGQGVFSLDDAGGHGLAAGAGPEWNMNSRHNFAGGFYLAFDYSLPSLPLALGLGAAGSYNFSNAVVVEANSFLRWYFPGVRHSGFFVQADAGFYYIMETVMGTRETFPMFMGGLRLGYRLPLGRSFYIEPYGRGGYPFVFSVGLMAGIRFQRGVL